MLPTLRRLFPSHANERRLIEPFAGGAALFFELNPTSAILSDLNPDLILLYRTVREALPSLLVHLAALATAHSPEHYYRVRSAYNARSHQTPAERAAMLLYLNKTCFNGLYRVNRRGEFNVPLGSYRKPTIVDSNKLSLASVALKTAELLHADFATVLQLARPGDFVYLDPPYVPESKTANFTAYTRKGFGPADQERLREIIGRLDQRGCYVMLSNSDKAQVRALYAGYAFTDVSVPRSINCCGSGRGRKPEVVIRNYSD